MPDSTTGQELCWRILERLPAKRGVQILVQTLIQMLSSPGVNPLMLIPGFRILRQSLTKPCVKMLPNAWSLFPSW